MNDKGESISIKDVFKNRKGGIPDVSSNKSMIGRTLGAAGAIEAVAKVLSGSYPYHKLREQRS